MKLALIVSFALCASAAFAQSGSGASALNAEPQITQFYSHNRTATQQPMAISQDLLTHSDYVYAQGERPLWEVAPKIVQTPLGDIARSLKKEHLSVKKAVRYWEN